MQRLLLVLVLITGVNALFFWQDLSQLFDLYREVSQTQKIVGVAGDLGREFLEENKLRLADSPNEKRGLVEIRKNIKKNLSAMRDLVTDKNNIDLVQQIRKEWNKKHNEQGTYQLTLLLKTLVSNQQKLIIPLEARAQTATSATIGFVVIYMTVFMLAIFLLAQYLKRKVFRPLLGLSEKMKNFEAGHHELPPQTKADDEIGSLESQFYNMAGRVAMTVHELKELDKVKTDFISIVSHELRTPMTSVKGSLSLLLSGVMRGLSGEIIEILTIAEKETDRLIRLINDILDLTKIEAKKLPLTKKWNSISEVIDTAVKGVAGLYEVSKVSVRAQYPDYSIKTMMDRDRIQQVITNLLSNAVKFSPPGTVVIIRFEEHSGGVLVSVTDKGPGIRPEFQNHMFEKFTSYEAGQSKIFKGTGLGLPICKAIVEQHGGQIGLSSELGKGSTFFFYLPEATTTELENSKEPEKGVAA